MSIVMFDLQPRQTTGAEVTQGENGVWRLAIPSGPEGHYRLAQLDDYAQRPRRDFPWHPPLTLSLRGRVSSQEIPGTWGFGLWNDPFSLSLGFGGATRRLPALPNAVWFFFASPPNYLSLRDDLPALGPLAATFRSPTMPPLLLAFSATTLPLLALRPLIRWGRRVAQRWIEQDAALLPPPDKLDFSPSTDWRTYTLHWGRERASFQVDGEFVLGTPITPRGPLGLVIWVDNQYAALPPDGKLGYGTLPNPEPAWIEITNLEINA